jgi:hypothetical protein
MLQVILKAVGWRDAYRVRPQVIAGIAIFILGHAGTANAWHEEGHEYAARAAVAWLPDGMPEFFVSGVDAIAHGSITPDIERLDALPQLKAANGPEHYFDLELLEGRDWPATRLGLIALCHELDVDPKAVGFLPYAIAERTQALAVAFAEHRRFPDDLFVQMRCLVIAGELAHFAADLHMPLHTTIHFDGRVPPQSPDVTPPPTTKELAGDTAKEVPLKKLHQGIHARVDALPGKIDFDVLFPPGLTKEQNYPFAMTDLMSWIQANLKTSHAQVDPIYTLINVIPAVDDPELNDPTLIAWTATRIQQSAGFTATLYQIAWTASAQLKLPDWLDPKPVQPSTPANPVASPETTEAGESADENFPE